MPDPISTTIVQTPAPAGEPAEKNTQTGATPTFEEWLEKADETTKNLISNRFSALENTVKATRSERDSVRDQLRDAVKKAEKGSEAEKSLNEALQRLDAAERKSSFLEDAVKPSVGCRNPRAAYAIAVNEDLFSKSGSPDWDAIKLAAPELFGIPVPKAKAGTGTEEDPPKPQDMNAIIRRAAGVH